MGLIHVLDTEVSNKIAAGEVVERPLSIVKELVENSIDAGATSITVEIQDGGIKSIRITDNGSGMSEEDAKVCFLRHATSKIKNGSDLEAIYTLGFRGEALSSIGAVTKVQLYTKRREDETGVCVTCEGGEILSSQDAGAPDGTVIEVRDLFYNTPARLKFLKKPSTEAGYISDIMARFVFAHPEISFRFVKDGKEAIFSAGDNKLMNAVFAVYGKDYARNMLEVDFEGGGIHVTGAIGKGTLTRGNRNYESFFVNRRYIKSPLMVRALEEAYKNQIMISKFPTAILNIDIDVTQVDINVHPTKLECKFANEQEIYQAVYHAVKNTLYALPNVPEIERKAPEPMYEAPKPGVQAAFDELFKNAPKRESRPVEEFKFKTEKRDMPRSFVRETTVEERKPLRRSDLHVPAISEDETAPTVSEKTYKEDRSSNVDAGKTVDTFAMLDYALERSKGNDDLTVNDPSGESAKPESADWDWKGYRDKANMIYEQKNREQENIFDDSPFTVVGQIFDTYIIVEKNSRMLMIDQHAAHERLNYEKLKDELEESHINSQVLIEPVKVKLSGEEFAVYSENVQMLEKLGFETKTEDGSTVLICAAPGEVGWSEAEPLFTELISQLGGGKQELIPYEKQRIIYTIACKASVKANMRMSTDEMRSLVERVFALKNINTCPHGRPIVISMSRKEIEKEFKRIV